MVEVRAIAGKAEEKIWIQFQNRLYAGCPQYVPTLDFDERDCFDAKKNPVLAFCPYERFLAWKDGKAVGRVCALINPMANEKWGVRKCRFGWIDFIDDMEVSRALLDKVSEWGRAHGMDCINGPVGFTDMDKEGALTEGYDRTGLMATLYNFPYYIRHYEAYGLTKDNDWIEYQVKCPKAVPERWERLAKIVTERSKLHVVKVSGVKELLRRYPNYEYFDVLEAAYNDLYNYAPLTQEMKRYYSEIYFGLLNFDMVTIVENDRNELVGIGIGMPELSDALRKANGSLFPFGWFHLLRKLKAKKHHVWNFLLIGIRPDYQDCGVHTLIFKDQIEILNRMGVEYMETTSMMETNHKILTAFNATFECTTARRRRAYIKQI